MHAPDVNPSIIVSALLLIASPGCLLKGAPGSPASGAVYGELDLRHVEDQYKNFTRSTVAIFAAGDFPPSQDVLPWLNDRRPEKYRKYPDGDLLKSIKASFGDLRRGAQCGGVLVAPNVVVSVKHCFRGPGMKMKNLRVIFGFDSIKSKYEVFKVEKIWRKEKGDLAMLKLSKNVPDEVARPQEVDSLSLGFKSGDFDVVAFGHPFGTIRLMSGGPKKANIADCKGPNSEVRVRATLDLFYHSSGSPVYIRKKGGDWSLFGLVSAAVNSEINCVECDQCDQCDQCGQCDFVQVPSLEACRNHAGAIIKPLSGIEPMLEWIKNDQPIPAGWVGPSTR